MTPVVSVILPAVYGWQSVLPALGFWTRQTRTDRIEILVAAPDADLASGVLPPGCVAVATGTRDLHDMRALAIRRARGNYVILAEDHCVPDPDFIENLLPAIEREPDAVGASMQPGGAGSPIAHASFLLGYGQWLLPSQGPARALPGHNVLAKRELLLGFGEKLSDELLIGAFLVAHLRDAGARFEIEPAARLTHFDVSSVAGSLKIFFTVGLGFGAVRTRSWRLPARWLYPLAAPAIAAAHWWRGLREYRRAGRQAGLHRSCLLAALPLAAAWAIGEAIGALFGQRRMAPHIWKCEVKPLSEEAAAYCAGGAMSLL